jgi:Tol biopolymer transport system component
MTVPGDRFGRDLSSWLDSEADVRAPAWLHDAAIARVVQTHQRPAWLVRIRTIWSANARSGDSSRLTAARIIVVVALLALVLAMLWVVAASPRPPLEDIRNGQILVGRQATSAEAQYVTFDPDGSSERRLFEAAECGQCAWWSPDGRRIIFPETIDDRLVTAIVRADGAAKVVLQPLPESTVNLGPAGWSVDGSLIALAGWDDTDPTRRGIYVATPEGADLRQVSRSDDGRPHDWATFSPDGSRVLYLAQDPVGPTDGGIAGDLFVVRLDGTDQRQVNPAGTKVVATVRVGRPMDWSPDGETIAFAAIEGDIDSGQSAIFLANAEGADARRISNWSTGTDSVDWAPLGSSILAGDATDGVDSIWLIDAESTERTDLWTSTASDAACCGTWSPDATLILFERGPAGGRDLWTMRTDGTIVDQVTDLPADYIWYSWGRSPE